MRLAQKRIFLYVSIFFVFVAILCACKAQLTVRLSERDNKEVKELLNDIDDLNGRSHYAEAVPKAQRLITLVEKSKGQNHPGTASCLNILGGLYSSSGDYKNAELILKRAVTILESAGQTESQMLAASLGLLAKVQLNLGQFQQAESSATKAFALREQKQGETGSGTSTALNTLAEIHMAMDLYPRAEAELLRAVDIRARHDNLHGLIISLNSLCRLYCLMHEFRKAEPIARDVLELGREVLGSDHLHVAESLNLLAWIYAATGRERSALDLMREAQQIDTLALDQIKGVPSERQKMAFVADLQDNYYDYLSLIVQSAPTNSQAVVWGMDAVLQRKGIILDVQKQFQQAMTRGDADAMEVLAQLNDVRGELSQLAFADSESVDMASYAARRNALSVRRNQLEVQLGKLSGAFLRSTEQAQASTNLLAKSLPVGSALVEIVSVRMKNFKAKVGNPLNKRRYFAFILLPHQSPSVKLVDLGDARAIDAAIEDIHFTLPDSSPQTNGPDAALRSLRRRVFAPIERELGNVTRLFVSPDGALNLLPFEILPDDDGRYLVQDYEVTYLNSGRDLIGKSNPLSPKLQALLMGDPDFDLSVAATPSGGAMTRSAEMATMQFAPLPATRAEVNTISEILGKKTVKVLLGAEANEDNLFKISSPRYLHLATHGFFLSDQILSDLAGGDSERSAQMLERMENPLLRSGIVLAGANSSLKRGKASGGVVTAEKILGMDLSNTELAVLSACETGVGEVNTGEGVFGLQRSFAQAGTRSLVMSMWPVSDRETMELMTLFYHKMSAEGLSPNKALREAMLAEMRVLANRYGKANPALWGAFVYQQCVPEWR